MGTRTTYAPPTGTVGRPPDFVGVGVRDLAAEGLAAGLADTDAVGCGVELGIGPLGETDGPAVVAGSDPWHPASTPTSSDPAATIAASALGPPDLMRP
jgi:hypothetical protein